MKQEKWFPLQAPSRTRQTLQVGRQENEWLVGIEK
jgi:hypothetical protein